MNRNRHTFGIRWKFFGYMMLFLVLLLGLLWLLQVVFFGEIYKSIRVSEIKASADAICNNIDSENTEIANLTESISLDKQVCVLIFDESGNILVSEDALSDCIIHTMSARNIYALFSSAKRDGGERLSRFYLDAHRNIRPENNFYNPFTGEQLEMPNRSGESFSETIIYTKIVFSKSRKCDVAVMLNTTISPVASTVRALVSELFIISIIMIAIAVLLSFILARRVSRPIVKMSGAARKLAEGNYGIDFPLGGYKEIAELSQTLTFAASELSKTEVLQRELMANISHDLRTPLTMITGYAEVMRDIPGENTPENVQIIIDEAKRLGTLVDDVLDISKLQSGTVELDIGEFNITDTIREVIGRFARFTEQDGYTIEFTNDFDVVVNADRTRILQVLYNFINNAIIHSGNDRKVIVSQRIITKNDKKTDVRIEVTDHGAGISPDELPHIWDRYYKAAKRDRRSQNGSGLGLSIVKHILDLHGARYGVDSTPEEGSTFWFEL